VARSGSAALSNTAIARFLLTPAGLAVALLWVLGYLFGQLLLSAGLMALAALALAERRVTVAHSLGTATRSSLRLLRFGARQLAALALIFAPFLGLAAVLLAVMAGLTVLGVRLWHEVRIARAVSVIAHRGSSRDAPENTLAAVRTAIEHGADYAEIDAHLTADGVPVVRHDEDLQRLAADPRRPGELSLAELKRIDGLITNDPVAAQSVRRGRQELPAWERVVLGLRRRLAGR
jgi:hypothetical protein